MATTTAASPPPSSEAPALQVNGSTPTTTSVSGEKRAELRMTMLKKLRPYPLRHEWVFWHDRSVEPPKYIYTILPYLHYAVVEVKVFVRKAISNCMCE